MWGAAATARCSRLGGGSIRRASPTAGCCAFSSSPCWNSLCIRADAVADAVREQHGRLYSTGVPKLLLRVPQQTLDILREGNLSCSRASAQPGHWKIVCTGIFMRLSTGASNGRSTGWYVRPGGWGGRVIFQVCFSCQLPGNGCCCWGREAALQSLLLPSTRY